MRCFKKSIRANIDLVMNLQGDEPLINIDDIRNLNKKMIESFFKIRNFSFQNSGQSSIRRIQM